MYDLIYLPILILETIFCCFCFIKSWQYQPLLKSFGPPPYMRLAVPFVIIQGSAFLLLSYYFLLG